MDNEKKHVKTEKEFQKLLPPLSEQEYAALEADIVKSGRVHSPLLTWNGILIDGHNRYEICQKHGIAFECKELNFNNKNEAKLWMINHQLGRRNISDFATGELVLKKKTLVQNDAKKRMQAGTAVTEGKDSSVEILPQGKTRDILGNEAGISGRTLDKVEHILESAPPEIIDQARMGTISINTAFKSVKKHESQENDGSVDFARQIRKMEEWSNAIFDCKNDLSEEDKKNLVPIIECLQNALGDARIDFNVSNDSIVVSNTEQAI